MSLKTSMTPEYIPGGAVCKRDFKVSGAMATTQFITPAEPPASNILAGLNSSRLHTKELLHTVRSHDTLASFLVE